MVLIGGLAAFLLAGPLARLAMDHPFAARPQLSTSPPSSPAGSTQAEPAGLPLSGPTAAPGACLVPAFPATAPPVPDRPAVTLPTRIWVNDPLGVNLRAAPDASSERLDTLSQATAATAFERVTDKSGAAWYRVSLPDRDVSGWVMAAFVVTSPVRLAVFDGWQALLPDGYRGKNLTRGVDEVRGLGEAPYPFLRMRTDFTYRGPEDGIRWDVRPTFDHSRQVQVWNYTSSQRVWRYALDTCRVPSAATRSDGGWPYVTSVVVRAPQRTYEFIFFTEEPESPLVAQVLASVLIS